MRPLRCPVCRAEFGADRAALMAHVRRHEITWLESRQVIDRTRPRRERERPRKRVRYDL